MTNPRLMALAAWLLLAGANLTGETNAVVRQESDGEGRYVTVTQNVCRAFSHAQNRKVDRLRLCRTAEKTLAGNGATNCAARAVRGLRVERVNYIESNKVEAVFSVGR